MVAGFTQIVRPYRVALGVGGNSWLPLTAPNNLCTRALLYCATTTTTTLCIAATSPHPAMGQAQGPYAPAVAVPNTTTSSFEPPS